MNTIKCKNRSELLTPEHDMRVCLSTIRPQLKKIMKEHQAQVAY